ncbi:fibrillin-1-like [Ruditapes philippinarum]|uniref:fibrillin-1-like n=1 Tax=Ruditapes philippinarum TaxID=129788 RepID=UPI00295AC5DD|nr:fibrillin-1-like [Ruditapes philippinarum]
MKTDLCVNGKCENTEGSWRCVCDNHIYTHLQNTSDGDIQRYRCEGDYQYIGQLKLFTSIEENVDNTFWRKYLNNKITPLFSKRNREKINQNDGIPPMSDIFWKLDFLNSTKGSPHMFTILYVLHIGESVSTTWVNKFQDKVINESQNTKLGTVIVTIDKSTIIDESIFNLCNIDNKTQCDTETTSCEVHNGSYACPCKNGFSRQFNNPYQCQDINECQWKNMTDLCQRGQCINTEGSWDCICRNQKYSERYNKSLGVEMKRMRCEGEYQYIGNVSLKQGYNNTRSHVELELSNLFLKAPKSVNCSINDAAGEETAALYDIFKKLDIIEIANNENGNQDVLYVLHLGESVSIKCLNEKQQAIFTGNIGFVNASIVSGM